MNAAVQCLRHTPKLVDTIVQSVGDSTASGLLPSFANLLQQLCVPFSLGNAQCARAERDAGFDVPLVVQG